MTLLLFSGPWVNAEQWNQQISGLVSEGVGWHAAPWWIVENYMYKRLLEVGSSSFHRTPELGLSVPIMIRSGQSTVGGPKWTKIDLFRPKWAIFRRAPDYSSNLCPPKI